MKFISCAVVLISLVCSCYSYSFFIPSKIGLPGVCLFNGLMLQRGDNNMPYSCLNMHCNEDGSILVQGCGHFDKRDCRVLDPININKPYPECCKMNFLCTLVNGQLLNKEVIPTQMGIYA